MFLLEVIRPHNVRVGLYMEDNYIYIGPKIITEGCMFAGLLKKVRARSIFALTDNSKT